MSGAWERSFTLNDPTALTLTFYYKLDIGSTYEQGEDAQALVSLDGTLLPYGGNDHIAELLGGGATTVSTDTVTLNLGTVAAGTHTLAFGGYSTGKDAGDELTKVFFDNILLEGSGPTNTAPVARNDTIIADEDRVAEETTGANANLLDNDDDADGDIPDHHGGQWKSGQCRQRDHTAYRRIADGPRRWDVPVHS